MASRTNISLTHSVLISFLAHFFDLMKWVDSYLRFRLTLIHLASCFFFLYRLLSSSLCTIFGAISSKIDEAL